MMCACSLHLQFLTLGSCLWLPRRPLQQEVHHDCGFDYVDLNILLLLFRHRVGKRKNMQQLFCAAVRTFHLLEAAGLTCR